MDNPNIMGLNSHKVRKVQKKKNNRNDLFPTRHFELNTENNHSNFKPISKIGATNN